MKYIILDSYCCCKKLSQSVLKHKNVFSHHFGDQKSEMCLTGLKSPCQQAAFLLETLGKNPFPCLIQFLEVI